MFKKVFLFIALPSMIFSGAGCMERTAPAPAVTPEPTAQKNVLPELDIISPGLEATTSEETIDIVGTTNQENVQILNARFPVIDDHFNVTVNLEPGEMVIPIAAGNGMVTTTINLHITRTSN